SAARQGRASRWRAPSAPRAAEVPLQWSGRVFRRRAGWWRMAEFVQALWGGILVGSVYGLMAIGLTLVWGALRLLNLADGSMFIVGAYAALAVVTTLNLPIFVGLLAGVIAA